MNLELGRTYKATLIDDSKVIFTFIGGENSDIKLESGKIIPIQRLPRYISLELLPDD